MEIDLLLPVLPPNLYLAVEGSLMLYKNGRREEEGINFKREEERKGVILDYEEANGQTVRP